MSRFSQRLILFAVAGAALLGGYLFAQRYSSGSSTQEQQRAGATAILAAELPDLTGRLQKVEQWKGRPLVVNFWATWCQPCREEIPALMRVQRKYQANDVQVVGIAIDQADKVKAYAVEMGIGYPLLIGELEALDLTRHAGNQVGGLPYTVVFDRAGQIHATQLGGITEEKLDGLLKPLL